jgi:hypothetical protein
MMEGYTKEEINAKKEIMQELMQREKQEEILWQQKSRKLWLREGDRNTSFFHKSTIQHRKHNRITRLKSPDGQILENHLDMEQELVNYYSELLSESEGGEARDTSTII